MESENNTTISVKTETPNQSFNLEANLINLVLSSIGILTNSILLIILLRFRRHQCTTYFLLTLMTIFDLVYCLVYISILLTNHSYLNLINHQILCPLSFFLSPFTFTGSTLLLFICLVHLITNFTRHYDTFLGQIGGRLSIVFVLAFILIRSVLGSTSIELISDPSSPHTQYCTIDMNTPDIVVKVQNLNQMFAEVTDILVYIGWMSLLLIYFNSLISCKKSNIFYSIFLLKSSSQQKRNQNRHRHVSLIIIFISLLSLICYLPVMINKLIAIIYLYFSYEVLSSSNIFYLQIVQQTTHLFCLAIRFLPYFLFDKQMKSIFKKCIRMKLQSNDIPKKSYQKYICYCQFLHSRKVIKTNTTTQMPIDV